MEDFVERMTVLFNADKEHVLNAIDLIIHKEYDLPYVAKYQKNKIGILSENDLRRLLRQYEDNKILNNIKKRYLTIIEGHYKLHPEGKEPFSKLKNKIEACQNKCELEDLYFPFKPKRNNRTTKQATSLGSRLLVENILAADKNISLDEVITKFLNNEKENKITAEHALEYASQVLSEKICANAELKKIARNISYETAKIITKKIEPNNLSTDTGNNQEDPYSDNQQEEIEKVKSNQFMELRKAEANGLLVMKIKVDEENIVQKIHNAFLKEYTCHQSVKNWVLSVIKENYLRNISPALENEIKLHLKEKSESELIKGLSNNLQKILITPPLPTANVLGIQFDGWKNIRAAFISDKGKILAYTVLNPNIKDFYSKETIEAIATLKNLIHKYRITYIAIGSGKGSKDLNRLLAYSLKNKLKNGLIQKYTVNRVGADIIAKEALVRKEFTDIDISIISSISIARRLQNPLTELSKLDPRDIVLSKNQQDYNIIKLEKVFRETIISCAHAVGVNLNTASEKLLQYISGISPDISRKIVDYRKEKGPFTSKKELNNIQGIKEKALEQALGFLKIPDAKNPLDNSGIHPNLYDLVQKIADDHSTTIDDLIGNNEKLEAVQWDKYKSDTLDEHTLKNLSEELQNVGTFIRKNKTNAPKKVSLISIEQLKINMEIKGKVKNIASFGAFVDIGAEQDGLIHISELSNDFVKDPSKIVSIGESLTVRVIGLDLVRKRINLSCKTLKDLQQARNTKSNNTMKYTNKLTLNKKLRPYREAGNSNIETINQKNYSMDDLMNKFNRHK